MQKLKIDCLKFNGAKTFTAKDGTEFIAIPIEANGVYVGQKGHYLTVTLMENRDGPSKFGDDGFAVLEITKEQRDAGEKGPIIGNWKHHGTKGGWNDRPASEATRQPSGQRPATRTQPDDDCSDIPW